jgi:hypothetical protein
MATIDTATRALSRARDDYNHALKAAMEATSPAALKRHKRRARVAASRIADARRDCARLTTDLDIEAFDAILAA